MTSVRGGEGSCDEARSHTCIYIMVWSPLCMAEGLKGMTWRSTIARSTDDVLEIHGLQMVF